MLTFAVVSGLIYFGLAAALIIFGKPGGEPDPEKALSFEELFLDYGGLPVLETYPARDGTSLEYRRYPASSDRTLILLHGSGWHSRYFMPLAQAVAASGAARVYTPGSAWPRPFPGQAGGMWITSANWSTTWPTLIAFIRKAHPQTRIVHRRPLLRRRPGRPLCRESLRPRGLGLSAPGPPFSSTTLPTTRPGSGGWARAYTKRIIGLSMLNNLGLTWFNHLPVIDFNMPEEVRDGTETLVYSHRLNTGFAPADYREDLKVMNRPLLVMAGEADQSFYADRYEPTIAKYTEAGVVLLPGVSHLGLVVVPESRPPIINWLKQLPSP